MTTDDTRSTGRPPISDSEIIERFGGIRPMAAKLGVAVTTVQGWKERGHIPAGRRQQIAESASEHGIDLGDGAPAAPQPASRPAGVKASAAPTEVRHPESRPGEPEVKAEASPEAAEAPHAAGELPPARQLAAGRTATIAWVALALAGVLALAVLTRPYWEGAVYPTGVGGSLGVTPAAVEKIASDVDRIDQSIGRMERDLRARNDAIEARVSALEAGGGEAGTAFASRLDDLEGQAKTLSQSIDALSKTAARIEDRLAALESAQTRVPDPVQQELDDIAGRLDRLTSGSEERDAGLNKRLDGIGKAMDGLKSRVTQLEERPIQTGEKIAALALAVGQLESALDSGRPYRSAMNRLYAVAGDDPVIADSKAMSALIPWADQGIPDRSELRSRFREIMPEIDRALARTADDNWLESVWNSIRGLVTIRRIDGTEDTSPVGRAEAAMDRGDLAAAAAAFKGIGSLGPDGDAWLSLVRKRLEAEQAIRELYGRVIAPLAGRSSTGVGTQ